MHKLTINRARIDFVFEPATPLLVKSGDKGAQLLHPERPDLMCVRTRHGGEFAEETVYVPGSSLKGVVRSSAERILRTLRQRCCDPMDQRSKCHREASRLGDQIARRAEPNGPHPMAEVYRKLCLACRTFGSQAMASRAAFSDAYPTPDTRTRANATETRNGVSIDRKTGGPSRGKLFDMEIVTGGHFASSIHMSNYELWQLALIGAVLRDIDDGFVRLGSAKSRGFGRVNLRITELLVDQVGTARGPAGVSALRPDLREPYGLLETDAASLADAATGTLGQRYHWKNEAAGPALDGVIDAGWAALTRKEGAA